MVPKWYEKTESSGLGIRVMPSGNKSWIYRFTYSGKRRKMTIGKYPATSLKQAREVLIKIQSLKEQNIDPIEHTQKEKNKNTTTKVKQLFIDWYENYALSHRKNPEIIKQQIDANIIPLLGDKDLDQVQAIDISEALDKIVKRGARIQANRVLSTIKQAFGYAVSRGNLQHNPAINIRARHIGGTEKPRERYLSLEEINKLWCFLDTDNNNISFQNKIAIKIILLTGVRTAEIRLAKWEEFDFENSLWTIPSINSKGGITVNIHLTTLVKNLLYQLKELTPSSPFVLPGKNPNNPLIKTALSRATIRIQDKVGIPKWRPHDLRRTFATQLGETLNVDPVVIEKCLGHKMPRIMATYNRNEMLPQRKEALEKWASLIESMTKE